MPAETLIKTVRAAVENQPITDIHTHLYPPSFGTPDPNASGATDPRGLLLWGLDELLTYHYLVAEVFRVVPATKLSYEQFWAMPKQMQADHIWKHLFIERSPISEACRGVITTLSKLGLDPGDRDLGRMRAWFAKQDVSKYIDRVMEVSHVRSITMTNDVFDDNERSRWMSDPQVGSDPRFRAVLRMDPLLRAWPEVASKKLAEWGYGVQPEIGGKTIEEARRFLRDWIDRMGAIYVAASLPPTFRFPADPADWTTVAGQKILEHVILPVCAERGLPLALMIGSRPRVNPALKDAGDMCGKSDIMAVVNLCHQFPENRFLITMLARENQHELCVAARKFGNLMIFGCWWFLNNPSLVEEIERMRFELLGTTFIPQHSDARVLDQMIYKWEHSRRIIADVLVDKYADITDASWRVSDEEIRRDVADLFQNNFSKFLAK